MSLYLLFADLFDYPDNKLLVRAKCAAELETLNPEAARLLKSFNRSLQDLGIARLQEAYTSAFDLQPECTLNLSYHLFGEDQRRGMFLAKLKEFYQEAGIETGHELPDHVSYLLRYVAIRPESEESRAIITDCLLPAISKISQGMAEKSFPYPLLLNALLLWLEPESANEAVSSGVKIQAGCFPASSG